MNARSNTNVNLFTNMEPRENNGKRAFEWTFYFEPFKSDILNYVCVGGRLIGMRT